jgi:hypothetical protein
MPTLRPRRVALSGVGVPVLGPGMDMARFRSSPQGRALLVLAATILLLIVSAIVLPPKASEVRSGVSGGEAPVTAPH